MADTITVEWTQTPPHFFEQRTELRIGGHTCSIEAGRVTCVAPYEGPPERDVDFRDELHRKLELAFRAAQLVSHETYELLRPTITRRAAGGGVHCTVFLEGGRFTARLGRIDIQITDAAGNVKVDSRADTIAAQERR